VVVGSRREAGSGVAVTIGMRRTVEPDRAREVAAAVRRQRRAELTLVHRALFSAAAEYRHGQKPSDPGVIGKAVTDRHSRVSVVVSTTDLDEAAAAAGEPAPAQPGVWEVHVSVAGHHRVLADRRVALSAGEEEGWARAVFSPAWEDHAYYIGHSALVGPEPIAHYALFLGPDHKPVPVPPDWSRPTRPYRLITEPDSAGLSLGVDPSG